jgi:hypothetical protein
MSKLEGGVAPAQEEITTSSNMAYGQVAGVQEMQDEVTLTVKFLEMVAD